MLAEWGVQQTRYVYDNVTLNFKQRTSAANPFQIKILIYYNIYYKLSIFQQHPKINEESVLDVQAWNPNLRASSAAPQGKITVKHVAVFNNIRQNIQVTFKTQCYLFTKKGIIIISAPQLDRSHPSDSEVFKTSEFNVSPRHSHYHRRIATVQLHARTQRQVHEHAQLYLRKSRIPSPTSAIGRRACKGFEQRFKFLILESLAQCL